MPFALPAERAGRWLDISLTDAAKALDLLRPNPDDAIAFHRVSARVSNARNQGADLIEALPGTAL
jgi:putative SOS response-associated peptidase YedK